MPFNFLKKREKKFLKKYVWYSSGTYTTAKNIANLIHAEYGKRIPSSKYDVVICWGGRVTEKDSWKSLNHLNKVPIYFNDVKIVNENRNKVNALKKIRDGGVRVPNFIIGYGECLKSINQSSLDDKRDKLTFPIIARTRYHQGGSGFELCLCKRDIRRAKNKGVHHHYLQYIPNDKEYRIHVLDGEIIMMSKKKGKEGCDNWKRNHDSGWVFSNIPLDNKIPNGVKNEAINAVKAMGLVFGAVDIIVSDYGEPFVIEINTGPGLSESGLDTYSKAITKYVNKEMKKND